MAAGTLSVTNNSKAVVGVGTTFTAFKAGDFLTLVVGQVPYTVAIASIESATALTLVLPFDGPTATGLAWDGVKRDTMSLATMGVTVQAQKALRLMIADENNWRAIFGEEEEISVTLPNGQVVQGMSWGYLSKLLKDVDPVELQAIADQTITAKNQAQGFRNEAEGFANSADASKKVPYAGVTLPAPTGVRDMLKRLRDSVKGGFWRVDDIAQFPSGEMTPFRYGPGVCGGAGDTFFAINVDWQTSRVKVFSGNNNAINGASGSVSAIELAKLGDNGDVAIVDGGTGASNDQGARKNLQAMHERQASLNTEDLNELKGDKAGFYFQSLTANATPERNYPVAAAGCLLVQRTGANVATSCVQTYTSYVDGRRWMRWISNGATGDWSQWYELYNAGSSPTFSGVITGSAVRASVDGKIITIKPGVNDVVIHNSASNKFLQLRDNGELAYDNKLIAYNGLAASGTFAMTVPSIKVTTANGGFRIDGTTSTNNQPLHVTGYNSAGTRLWFLGKDTGTNALFLNDITSSKVDLITDGVVLGTKNFAGKAYVQAASLEIDRPSGKYFKMLNDGNSSHPATFKLWGNGSDRPAVIEFGLDDGPGWLFYAQYNSNGTRQMNVNGTVNCMTVNQSSDRELEDNIKPIENARAGLAKMGGYTYTLKKDGMPYAGVIAQEVMDVVPEAVSTFEDYEHLAGPTQDGEELVGRQRFFQVDYGAIAAYAVQVCKEQEEELVSLRSELEELKAAVAALTKA